MFPVPRHSKGHKSPIPGNVAFQGKDKQGNDVIFTQMTRGMKKQPFMRPAIFNSKDDIARIIGEELSR